MTAEALFNEGKRRGEDPVNAVAAGPAITSGFSEWFGTYCGVCHHNFRRNDPVTISVDDGGRITEARHNPELVTWCGQGAPGQQVDRALATAFFEAIDAEDPPPVRHTVRLHPGDPLLEVRPARRARDRRQRCLLCAQTFRPYEFVVVCVCSPAERKCALSIHRDPGHNLLCYDEYTRGQQLRQCPMDYRVL